MRDSIGGSMLLYIVIIFVTAVLLLFSSILTYSKAYKIKNRIIEIIEKYGVYEKFDEKSNNLITEEINQDLKTSGYSASNTTRCNSTVVQNHLRKVLHSDYHSNLPDNINDYGYNYCVFEINSEDYPKNILNGRYYIVVTFVEFQFPVINDIMTFPVYGETQILGKNYDYE